MKKYFKSRRVRKLSFMFWIIIFVTSIFISTKLVNFLSYDYIVDGKLDNVFNINIDREKLLLKMSLNYEELRETSKEVFEEIYYSKPKIYIYNTHQSEEYADGDIFQAAKLLKQELESHDIEVILEETNIGDALKKNNFNYNDSYKITKELLTNIIKDDISLYIDLHRDSSNKNVSTTTIDNVNYARVMFVVGGKHETYLDNYRTSDNLNKMIKNINPNLSRGIYVRKSSSYNQDLASNVVLIELGGPYNTMEEVSNTVKLLANAIVYYINE